MTINEQSKGIIQHPAFKNSINAYSEGDDYEIIKLLNDLQLHVADMMIQAIVREYGQCKRMNSSDIKDSLENVKLPATFDFRMKIPPKDNCTVVDIREVVHQIKKRVVRYFNPQQLAFAFPEMQA